MHIPFYTYLQKIVRTKEGVLDIVYMDMWYDMWICGKSIQYRNKTKKDHPTVTYNNNG